MDWTESFLPNFLLRNTWKPKSETRTKKNGGEGRMGCEVWITWPWFLQPLKQLRCWEVTSKGFLRMEQLLSSEVRRTPEMLQNLAQSILQRTKRILWRVLHPWSKGRFWDQLWKFLGLLKYEFSQFYLPMSVPACRYAMAHDYTANLYMLRGIQLPKWNKILQMQTFANIQYFFLIIAVLKLYQNSLPYKNFSLLQAKIKSVPCYNQQRTFPRVFWRHYSMWHMEIKSIVLVLLEVVSFLFCFTLLQERREMI